MDVFFVYRNTEIFGITSWSLKGHDYFLTFRYDYFLTFRYDYFSSARYLIVRTIWLV